MRGVDIKIKFTPGPNADVEQIGLTQSVQAYVNNSLALTPAASTRAISSADAVNINAGAEKQTKKRRLTGLPDLIILFTPFKLMQVFLLLIQIRPRVGDNWADVTVVQRLRGKALP